MCERTTSEPKQILHTKFEDEPQKEVLKCKLEDSKTFRIPQWSPKKNLNEFIETFYGP